MRAVHELPKADEVSLTVAALRIRRDYHAARALMLRGEMKGRRVGLRWYVAEADVARLEAQLNGQPASVA